MRMRLLWFLALPAMAFVGPALAQQPRGAAEDKNAIARNAAAFIEAFHKGDTQALAAFWTADGDYMNQTGQLLKGRKAIAEAFQKMFAQTKGAKLRIHTTTLRLVKDDLAIEDGMTEVFPPDGGAPTAARYTAVHVKQNGKWLLASVRDAVALPPSEHRDHLAELEWLTGDWVDEDEKGDVARASYSWAENDNFLVSTFVTTLKDVPVAGGTQWIGWDPAGKRIRSWTFDSTGGFSQALWSKNGSNKWAIQTSATLGDGKQMKTVNIITRVDADHVTWQSTKRTLDGKALPDTEEVKMKRAK